MSSDLPVPKDEGNEYPIESVLNHEKVKGPSPPTTCTLLMLPGLL